ncbi:hypothetical protein BOTCAL_0709g00040 [Botryotinia calthae]|uniref:Uncharacterized protein n=1 Tax=Botryotinia calthae TaxID=38488 RepID=A0A4Y8CJ36_9HELO|nr:hypothetical protein BOTCAL_0709g00040 [Botryotinia calthae]
MQPLFPCPTATWHKDTYENISPLRSELSVAGKTVIIIGGGSGIGRETVYAFASAGAAHIALLGRTDATLQETAKSIPSTSKTSHSVHVADLTKTESLKTAAAAAVGKWNILVICSGYCPTPSPIPSSKGEDWWKGFEVSSFFLIFDPLVELLIILTSLLARTNVYGTFLATKAFLPTADSSQAAILGVTSDVSLLPVTYLPGLSSYVSSKLAQAKIYEFIAAENPSIFVATVNPGMVETENFYRTGATPDKVPIDTVQLPAHFLVWMASPEATFLRGRCAWANWDVEELKAQKDMILEGLFMTAGFKGLPKI